MKKIVVFGAGRSSIYLIEYLLKYVEGNGGSIHVYDRDRKLAEEKIGGHKQATAASIDIQNREERRKAIVGADIVVSMVPHSFHIEVAKDCLEMGVNMSTASYISEEMQALHEEAKSKGLIVLNE